MRWSEASAYPDNVSLGLVYFMPLNTSGCQLVITEAPNKEIDDNQLCVFPNPVSDKLTVRLPREFSNGNIRLYNLLGRLYSDVPISSQETIIDVSDLSEGVYIIEVLTNNNVSRQKFIKD